MTKDEGRRHDRVYRRRRLTIAAGERKGSPTLSPLACGPSACSLECPLAKMLPHSRATPKSPLFTQVRQSDPKALTSSKLPPADKDGSGPGCDSGCGDSGGGSDPPLTEPSAFGQGPVLRGDGGCGGGAFKCTIIGGSSKITSSYSGAPV